MEDDTKGGEQPQGNGRTETLSTVNRVLHAASYTGQTIGLAWYFVAGTTVFNIFYGAPAAGLGAIGIALAIYSIFIGFPIARLADAGTLNKFFCFPLRLFGRRGPWIALGAPVLALCALLYMVKATDDPVGLLAYYTVLSIGLLNAYTAINQSTLSVLQETMITDIQKTTQTLLLIPFELVGSLLAAVVLPAITFTVQPDTIDACCIQPLIKCGKPLCACYEDLGNDTVGLLQVYDDACPNVAVNNVTFAKACAEERVSLVAEQFLRTGLILFFIILTTLVGIVPASYSKARNESEPFKLWPSIKEAFSHYSFRLLALRQGVIALNSQILVGFGSFFLLFNVGVDFEDLGGATATVGALVLGGALVSAPAWYLVIRLRKEDGITPRYHPADIAWTTTTVATTLSTLCYAIAGLTNDINALYAGAAVVGLLSGPLFQVISILFGWIIDEDEEKHSLRREGMFYACSDASRYIAIASFYILLAVLGALGQDPTRCPQDQPPEATNFVFFVFTVLTAILQVIAIYCLYKFPIRGERLQVLLKRNAGLIEREKAKMPLEGFFQQEREEGDGETG